MFYLFAGNDYYPEGGFNDFKGSFISLDLAIGHLTRLQTILVQRVPLKTRFNGFKL